MGRLATRDKPYQPLSIYVLDPLEYVALGLHVLKGKKGEKRWAQCQNEKWKHPDPQKTCCVFNGAIIYTALWPDRTHRDHRPPADWLIDSGITEETLWEAKKQLIEQDPDWQAKRDIRAEINEVMDQTKGSA